MTLIILTDRFVNVLPHGEDHVDNPPDDKDENEARRVGESGKAPRPIYDHPPLGGAATLGG